MVRQEGVMRPRTRRFKTIESLRHDLSVELSPREELLLERTAFQEAVLNAWFATALEQTKSVFTLASAGVGLTLTLIFTSAAKNPPWNHYWLVLAACMFAIASGLCIAVFRFNRNIAEGLATNKSVEDDSALVHRFDLTARLLFAIALVFLVFAAVAQVWF
jgi:hypothetical protein